MFMIRSNWVFLAAAISVASAATLECAATDDNGAALVWVGETSDGFVRCSYESDIVCTYFATGDFSSGGSDCPSSLVAGEVEIPPATATCPAFDNEGGVLEAASLTDDGFLACDYENAFCTYFAGNGGFSSGSSVCPASADVAERVVRRATATCPATDNNGGALESSGLTDDGFLTCDYVNAFCTYFINGGFSSGSSVCPSSATAAVDEVADPSPIAATCSATDNAGSALIRQGQNGSFITCTYRTSGICAYFSNGGFSSGGSTCPGSLSRRALSAISNRDSAAAAVDEVVERSPLAAACPATDNAGSPLIRQGQSGGFVTCVYRTAGTCTYFTNGGFSSGGSTCPSSIPRRALSAKFGRSFNRD